MNKTIVITGSLMAAVSCSSKAGNGWVPARSMKAVGPRPTTVYVGPMLRNVTGHHLNVKFTYTNFIDLYYEWPSNRCSVATPGLNNERARLESVSARYAETGEVVFSEDASPKALSEKNRGEPRDEPEQMRLLELTPEGLQWGPYPPSDCDGPALLEKPELLKKTRRKPQERKPMIQETH